MPWSEFKQFLVDDEKLEHSAGKMLRRCDKDHNSTLEHEEFLHFMEKNCGKTDLPYD